MADAEVTYPAKSIARLFDVSASYVGQLAKEGVITKAANGRYPAKVITEYIVHLRKKALGSGSGGTYREERARLMALQVKEKELELAERRGELVKASDVEEQWLKIVVAARSRFLSVPTKTAPKVFAAKSTAEVQAILEDAVFEALDQFSDGIPEDIPTDQESVESTPPADG